MLETAMVLFTETIQRPWVQRHSKLWVQRHPKGFGCLDTSTALGAEMFLPGHWVLRCPKGPGCGDAPVDLGTLKGSCQW